eukprot:TRINITY_DN2598_c0_g4_i10.p1 TRINITY_DN2598_c0_g4~~TRINITY_DN2598_c0_g4_i10.p1  ORF type:complete len:281 (-),score=1.50 TRINITY_DN2598_c0_g4_i10:50-862(-)
MGDQFRSETMSMRLSKWYKAIFWTIVSMSTSTTYENRRYHLVSSTIFDCILCVFSNKIRSALRTMSTTAEAKMPTMDLSEEAYRYGGFAVNSIIRKLNGSERKVDQLVVHAFRSFIAKETDQVHVPLFLKLLNRGGMTIINTQLADFTKELLVILSDLVNEQQLVSCGSNMNIKAVDSIRGNRDLRDQFFSLISGIQFDVEVDPVTIMSVTFEMFEEFCNKVINTKCGEFFNTRSAIKSQYKPEIQLNIRPSLKAKSYEKQQKKKRKTMS